MENKDKAQTNPTQPAGPQVGQSVNGNLDFPPDFGIEPAPLGTLGDLEDRSQFDRTVAEEDANEKRPDRRKANLDNENSIRGLDTPEGLG